MKRKLLLLIPVFGGFVLAALFTFFVSRAAIPVDPSRPRSDPAEVVELRSMVSPRRAISDPGIFSPLSIAGDGSQVYVLGHATCPEGSESVKVTVQVTQGGTGPKAIGSTKEACIGEKQNWAALAATPGQKRFSPGPAEVCALAIFYDRGYGGSVTRRWCKAVTLQ